MSEIRKFEATTEADEYVSDMLGEVDYHFYRDSTERVNSNNADNVDLICSHNEDGLLDVQGVVRYYADEYVVVEIY